MGRALPAIKKNPRFTRRERLAGLELPKCLWPVRVLPVRIANYHFNWVRTLNDIINCPRKARDKSLVNSFESLQRQLLTLRDWVRYGASSFTAANLHFGHGTDNALDEALALVLHAIHLNHDIEAEFLDARLTTAEKHAIHDLFSVRIRDRIPVPYLTGEAWFCGLRFRVDRRVLIPRSPIAELVKERFCPWVYPDTVRNVLDMCCGSGCIGIACAYAFPGADVYLADCSSDALAVARTNIKEHGLDERVHVLHSNLFAGVDGSYDVIVCNPPYVSERLYQSLPEEFHHEPREGLISGSEGLSHALQIVKEAMQFLSPTGILVLEVGAAAKDLEERLPAIPILWAELQHGGEGVAILTRETLSKSDRSLLAPS